MRKGKTNKLTIIEIDYLFVLGDDLAKYIVNGVAGGFLFGFMVGVVLYMCRQAPPKETGRVSSRFSLL